jgi:hypothetical protein
VLTGKQALKSDKELAVETLRLICEDIDAPKQARASAARTLLELSGDIGKLQSETKTKQNKSLSELTKSELDAEIARLAKPAPLDSPSAIKLRKSNARAKMLASKRKAAKRQARVQRQKYDI